MKFPWTRRRRAAVAEPAATVVTMSGRVAAVALADFVVTVDTVASGGDRLVLHLAREGEPTLHMQVGVEQFMWLLNDPNHFAEAYAARAQWADPYAVPEPGEDLAEVDA